MGISTSEQADDSERLLLGYFDLIRDSPSHIYHSALPLLPSSSWVRKCYGAEAAEEVRVVMGLPGQWDTCARTMMLENIPLASAHWGDIIAIGLGHDVVLFDAITGTRTSVLCGHGNVIYSLASSQDGTILMSGSNDTTVKVWDVQTGGVIRTFDHHPPTHFSASISSDGAVVALGTNGGTVRLCDVRTGGCNSIKMYPGKVMIIKFSPVNARRFISSSAGVVGQWDIDGHQIWISYHAGAVMDLAWTRDGTRFVSCGGKTATVRDAESGAVVVKLDAPDQSSSFDLGCFSPDGGFVACAADTTIWVWDITISGGRPVGRLVGHSGSIQFLTFSSSLISGGSDRSMKFWKSSSFSMDLTSSDQMAARGSLTEILSIKLFAEEGMVVTSDREGVVKVWDVMTGRCKASFSTPAKGKRDTHLARNTLIIVWCPDADRHMDMDMGMEYHIWDVYKGQLLRKFHSYLSHIRDLKISGNGSTIFGLEYGCIAAMSIQTGEEVGRVEMECEELYSLCVRGSKVWVDNSPCRRWDFEGMGVRPFEEFPDGPQLKLVDSNRNRDIKPCWVEDLVTKRRVFRSLEKYLDCGRKLKWDGRYLFNWSSSGEDIMIIDFDPVLCPLSGS